MSTASVCPTCGDEFGDDHARNVHHKMAHGESLVAEGDVECPTCSDSFRSEHGMKIHHAQVHNESIAYVTCACEWCGDEFEVRERETEYRDEVGTYCSSECLASANWERHQESSECPECGQEFGTTLSMAAHHASEHAGRVAETIEKTCDHCEDRFTVSSNAGHRRYCGRECWFAAREEREYPGPTIGNGYSSLWRRQREAALARDDYECQRCGLSEEEHTEQFDRGLHVHHIQPLRDFEDHRRAHETENLRTLCIDCHNEIEHQEAAD